MIAFFPCFCSHPRGARPVHMRVTLSPDLSTRLSLTGGELLNTHSLQNNPIAFHSLQRQVYGTESGTTILGFLGP